MLESFKAFLAGPNGALVQIVIWANLAGGNIVLSILHHGSVLRYSFAAFCFLAMVLAVINYVRVQKALHGRR